MNIPWNVYIVCSSKQLGFVYKQQFLFIDLTSSQSLDLSSIRLTFVVRCKGPCPGPFEFRSTRVPQLVEGPNGKPISL